MADDRRVVEDAFGKQTLRGLWSGPLRTGQWAMVLLPALSAFCSLVEMAEDRGRTAVSTIHLLNVSSANSGRVLMVDAPLVAAGILPASVLRPLDRDPPARCIPLGRSTRVLVGHLVT